VDLRAAPLEPGACRVRQQRAEALAKEGARVASSPRQAAEQADVVVSMLADDAASRSAWMGVEGALSGAKKGAVLIESSTLSPGWIAELSAAANSSTRLESTLAMELVLPPIAGASGIGAASLAAVGSIPSAARR